ncbi:hypothetical protein B0H11DRAFT_2361368 [Mycena galericulata]|nr:hypothetical protein B0H11DRAFT_2361368 [Mycena galericulata]
MGWIVGAAALECGGDLVVAFPAKDVESHLRRLRRVSLWAGWGLSSTEGGGMGGRRAVTAAVTRNAPGHMVTQVSRSLRVCGVYADTGYTKVYEYMKSPRVYWFRMSPFCPHYSPFPALETEPSRKRTHMSEERKRRNRISAQASRDRRKAQLLHLERQVTELEETNGQLRAGLAEATLQLDYLSKSSAAEGRSTGPTQPAPQPDTFIFQTSEAPGSGQVTTLPTVRVMLLCIMMNAPPSPLAKDIMSTVKKPASLAKAPKKAAKSKTTSSHPPWVDMITECITAHPEDTRQGVSRPQIKKFVEMKYKLSIGAAQTC